MDDVPESVGLSLYLATGWAGAVAGAVLWRWHGWAFVRPLALGGAAYTAGAAMEFLRWPVLVAGVLHPHDVFHVAVLAGALLHFAFVWGFADGRPPGSARGGCGGGPAES
jgi:channel protein (hemolysin III family)